MQKNIKPSKMLYTYLLCLLTSLLSTGCNSRGDTHALSIKYGENITAEKDTSRNNVYSWLPAYETKEMLVNRIALPEGYTRVDVKQNSFGDWLRHLPLKPGTPEVKLYDGTLKQNQSAQFAVVNIDVGNEDLQQCADAVMRLKAEYHFSKKEYDKIHFNFTSGDEASYSQWVEGYRPVINGNKVSWVKKAQKENSYKNFKAYMKQVFMYAGTSSLSKELQTVPLENMQPGDVFIKGGFPGHATLVVDMAVNKLNGKKIFMLTQSYMPAQDIHILKNPDSGKTPWYALDFEGTLETPEWTFQRSELKRFK